MGEAGVMVSESAGETGGDMNGTKLAELFVWTNVDKSGLDKTFRTTSCISLVMLNLLLLLLTLLLFIGIRDGRFGLTSFVAATANACCCSFLVSCPSNSSFCAWLFIQIEREVKSGVEDVDDEELIGERG